MHRHLDEQRRRGAEALGRARERAVDLARRRAEAPILERRSWPFPLYPPEMIDSLAAAVRDRVAVRALSAG